MLVYVMFVGTHKVYVILVILMLHCRLITQSEYVNENIFAYELIHLKYYVNVLVMYRIIVRTLESIQRVLKTFLNVSPNI